MRKDAAWVNEKLKAAKGNRSAKWRCNRASGETNLKTAL